VSRYNAGLILTLCGAYVFANTNDLAYLRTV